MKLRNLNGAIRKFEGAPTVGVMTPLGYIHVPVQKTGLMEALKTLSDDGQVETHMEIAEDGRLTVLPEGRAIIDAMEIGAADAGDPPFGDAGDPPFGDADVDLLADDTIDIEEVIAAAPVDDLLADLISAADFRGEMVDISEVEDLLA